MHASTTIYLFQSGETDRYALSIDKTGCNVPLAAPAWLLRGELDPDELPDDIRSTEGTSKLHFRWQERGGPLIKKPTRKGFGAVL